MLKWFRRRKAEELPPEELHEAPLVETVTPHHIVMPEDLEPVEPIGDGLPPDAELGDPEIIVEEPSLEHMSGQATEAQIEQARRAPEPAPIAEPAAEKKSFFSKMKDRLSRTKSAMVDSVMTAFRLHGKVDEELLEEIENILIQSDVGVPTTHKIVDRMRTQGRAKGALDEASLLALFKSSISEILEANNRPLNFEAARPAIMLFVGVNGTGKTTTIGKIGKALADRRKKVMMVAADTFRAAAADQLQIWAERTGSAIVRQAEGADPAAVVFEALEGARLEPPDVILIDTAGRLHTKVNLMEQLKKIRRVIQKHYPDAPHETILVLDATTGQNALNQLKTFNEATELTGLVMTKLDGTAKGGILIACKDAYQLPIFKIGIGEQAEDLRDFHPSDFVDALFSSKQEVQ